MELTSAKKGKIYKITGIAGADSLSHKLLDLGFTAGTEIVYAGTAPFGGSILVLLRGSYIALRPAAAARIMTERSI